MAAEVIESDVLIIGGGIAGCVAAIRAAEAGASVVLVDKARSIRRSGDAGRGLAFLTTYLDLGEEWDTPDVFASWYCDIALGLVDMSVARPVGIEPLPDTLRLLERCGVPLRNASGGYDRVGRMWTPGPIVLKFDGEHIKPRLAEAATASGARVVGGVHVTSIQLDPAGRAVGATGFDVRSCEFHTFRAGAVVIATGNAERVIFNSPRREPFNTYHRPYHGATGFALAARAGATAANIEFLGTFLFPRGFATGAMGNLLEAGGRLVNGNGQLIADLPDLPDGRMFGHGIVARAAAEVRAGRGPIYIDCTHLAPEVLADIGSYISYDAPLFREFLEQSGIDLARHPVEFELFNGAWSATGSPKGVVVDATCQTGVPGLFAAGDLATPAYALAGSLTSGFVAGRRAAEYAQGADAPRLDPDAVDRDRAVTLAPLNRTEGTGWQAYERELQDTMTRFVGMDRNAIGLRQAREYLAAYADAAGAVRAANGHELMRAHEAFDLRLFDEMMTAAAQERDETRFSFLMGHHRTDRPEPDPAWTGVAVLVSHDGTRPVVRRTVPTPGWRAERLAGDGAIGLPGSDAGGLAASAVPTSVVRLSTPAGEGK